MMPLIRPALPGDVPTIVGFVRELAEYEKLAYEIGRGRYAAPGQRARDFLAGRTTETLPKTSYPRETVPVNLASLLPPVVADAVRHGLPQMDRRWRGKFLDEAMLFGPESRGSSPVRIERDGASRESPGLAGLYPVGEGAGYAGGIVSAAVDGLRTARAIIAKHAVVG